MPQTEDTGVYEIHRETREWVPLTYFEDNVTARMNATYLEAAMVEVRITQEDGLFCIEVPDDQFDRAGNICDPMEKPGAPQMQESGGSTGIHSVLREQQRRVDTLRMQRGRKRVASRAILVALGVAAAIALLVFLS
jgi:hypothetical protein